MALDLSTGSKVTNTFQENTNPVDDNKTGLVFAGRKLPANNVLVMPQSNIPMPNLYVPFKLESYKDGLSALIELGKMGFNYVLGNTFDAIFENPNTVTINNSTGITTLVWNDPRMGIDALVGKTPVGTVTQSSASGTIVSVYIKGDKSFLDLSPSVGSPAFTTSANIEIVAELPSLYPDPYKSDEVCIAAFSFYEQYKFSPIFDTSPSLWLSVYITGIDNSISPSNTPIDLVAPSTVTLQPDGSFNLTYPNTAHQLGRLPTTYLGNTIVTQATSGATGTYNGYSYNSTDIVINVINVTGAFVLADAISIVLDITQNGGALTGKNEISCVGMGYNVSNIAQLKTDHADFDNVVTGFQSPDASEFNKFNLQGYYSYVAPSMNYKPLSQLTTPNVTYYKATAKLDIPTSLQYPCNAMMLTMASMFNDLNNEVPYNATNGETALLWCTASTNQATLPNKDALNQLANQGWSSIGITSNYQWYIFRNQCTLQSISGIVDNEYRFQELQQKVRWLDKNAYLTAEATVILPNGMRSNNNPGLLSDMSTNMKTLLSIGTTIGGGMLGSTNNSVVIGQATPTRLKITLTTTIISANSGNDINITIKPFTIATA
jgi:hypothetical protein